MSMEVFPELYELLDFFESEPEITDRDVPWFYNRLTYRTTRDCDKIYCAIEPGYGQIVLIWEKSGELVASLNFEYVNGLKIIAEKGTEKMVASFHESAELLDFELQLKPSIHIKWGNQSNG